MQHPLGSSVALSAIAAGHIMLASCATLSGEQRVEQSYDRADKLILARESFQLRAAVCEQQGGVMQIKRYGSSRVGKITAHEYNAARCVSY
ncbi:MAG: hypothetical protein KJO31_10945 [Gammaproteobacteria bacterium]|nr:hypothetical protein [Gammaproteobacteria bacterium]